MNGAHGPRTAAGGTAGRSLELIRQAPVAGESPPVAGGGRWTLGLTLSGQRPHLGSYRMADRHHRRAAGAGLVPFAGIATVTYIAIAAAYHAAETHTIGPKRDRR